MRYQHGKDWVEIAGANLRTMGELSAMDTSIAEGHKLALELTTDACFVNRRTGEAIEWQQGALNLHPQQWRWWKGRIWEAAFDEVLDPEV
jgi:hypothetical protein